MTDAPETIPEPYDFSTDPDNVVKDDVVANDLIFNLITTVLHGDDGSEQGTFALTMTIGGNVVSGQAIGMNEWMDGTQAQLISGNEAVGNAFTSAFDLIKTNTSETYARRKSEGRPTIAPRFIHMKDVTLNPGKNQMTLSYWRGVVSEISGWSLGSVNYNAS